ncbi:DUF2935 domain-containing protein [Pelotomaculum propionicicum]|uniref:DUF2935 domain-containing protein n=1 Tax=Pelotomaculum propionicicum TaxID=258475 RepID=A0A4Y7RUI2_9FIRM|nr:DUF2935 domain-containing protein [Pelotomaculum propionicicum]TEB12430.1 hypothetical protein Pmgp_01047 [Pelotomaculum propionicicum]
MLSNEDFVRQSLDLNLFFLRIMKEHSFFIEGGFTPANPDLAKQADAFKQQFEALLKEAVSLAQRCVGPDVLTSGEIVTNFTLNAEKATQFFTSIPIDTSITVAELALTKGAQTLNLQTLVQQVADLNQKAIATTQSLISFKTLVLDSVLACRLFTFNYPLLIDHIRREAILFTELLTRLQNRVAVDIATFAVEQESFWNRIMAEHAKFIRGLLDPTEEALFQTANNFGREFDMLAAEAMAAHNQINLLPLVTRESLRETVGIREFKRRGTEGILACKIKSIILPLLADHVLREANHYLRLLRIFSMVT